MNEKTEVHIFVWRAFHSYLKETKKINNQFLTDILSMCMKRCHAKKKYILAKWLLIYNLAILYDVYR